MDKIMKDFIQNNPIVPKPERDELVLKLSKEHPLFGHLKNDTELFMNLLDLTITQPTNFSDSQDLWQLTVSYNNLDSNITSTYYRFYNKLQELNNDICYEESITPGEVLISPNYFNLQKYKREDDFYKDLGTAYDDFQKSLQLNQKGALDINHPSHKIILKLNSLCNDYVDWNLGTKDNVKYLLKLYNYLRAFSKILYIEQDNSDIISKGKRTSFFDLLYHNRAELMGKLLFERHLDPAEFEKYFGKLKLDYLYHVVSNCFPTINLYAQDNITVEELYPENNLYIPSKSIITYIQKRNWLLAFILNEIYKVEGVDMDFYMTPKEIVTALQNDISTQKVSQYLNDQILKHDYMMASVHSQQSNDSLEPREIEEDALKSTNWKELFDIIDNIPEIQLRKVAHFFRTEDMILVNIMQDGFEKDYFKSYDLLTTEI
ncbi:hypothetical protein NQ317_018399 [Molorchus minor]|uniref:Uncharacterized protein n=1 Tax=Molorchus minor TaxID=1323400 RepID=A0ABQ9J7E6_9CUCU|nr:hypothetical protein NQ317_018399 [Molorchus minor]